MQMIVGLGNPGREYAATRHNLGFLVVDEVGRRTNVAGSRRRFRAEIAEARLAEEKLVLIKPQTYMNLSGHAVREALQWYHAQPSDTLVVLDDLDLPFGTLRLRANGSAGGHNGLESIITAFDTDKISRLRVGIGAAPGAGAVDYVLGRFFEEEQAIVEKTIERAAEAVKWAIDKSVVSAMNTFNKNLES